MTGWEAGIPLNTPGDYGLGIFHLKDDSETEHCNCTDAARWTPDGWPANGGRSLDPDTDEIGALIQWYRDHPEEPR